MCVHPEMQGWRAQGLSRGPGGQGQVSGMPGPSREELSVHQGRAPHSQKERSLPHGGQRPQLQSKPRRLLTPRALTPRVQAQRGEKQRSREDSRAQRLLPQDGSYLHLPPSLLPRVLSSASSAPQAPCRISRGAETPVPRRPNVGATSSKSHRPETARPHSAQRPHPPMPLTATHPPCPARQQHLLPDPHPPPPPSSSPPLGQRVSEDTARPWTSSAPLPPSHQHVALHIHRLSRLLFCRREVPLLLNFTTFHLLNICWMP